MKRHGLELIHSSRGLRDRPFELDTLRRVLGFGRRSAWRFTCAVVARLEAGEDAYGDRWRSQGFSRLGVEIREEGADAAAWALLAAQSPELSPDQRHAVMPELHRVIVAGAEIVAAVERAIAAIERGGRGR